MYLNWRDTITVTELDQVIATGAIPMVTWNCGDTDARVLAGRDDARVDEVAAVLAQFQFPVFLRWFPDPNVKTTAGDAVWGGVAQQAMWRPTNTFTSRWSIKAQPTWPSCGPSTPPHPRRVARGGSFYPGAEYVNWIGADGYATTSKTANVSNDFGTWYVTFLPTSRS